MKGKIPVISVLLIIGIIAQQEKMIMYSDFL